MRRPVCILLLALCCADAFATSSAAPFKVRVRLKADDGTVPCITGSASTILNQAIVGCSPEDGPYRLDGKAYRFLHLNNERGRRGTDIWGTVSSPKNSIHVYYDASLAAPVQAFTTLDHDTFELQVSW